VGSYAITVAQGTLSAANYSFAFVNGTLTVTPPTGNLAGFVVTPTAGLETTKLGGTATFTVVLTKQPTAPVTIPVSSSNITEGTVSTAALTFTPLDWYLPHSVTVRGVNDSLSGDVPYTIILAPPTTSDAAYNPLDPPDVAVLNRGPGVTVSPVSGLVTTASGGSASFIVLLNSPPHADVTLALISTNPAEGSLSTSSLTFTPLDWNTPHTVTIVGLDDHVADGNATYAIVPTPTTSLDAVYNGLNAPDVTVTNINTDTAAVAVRLVSPPATVPGSTETFQVVLASQPTATVLIPFQVSAPDAGAPSTTLLTFSPADWDTPQTVSVIGVNPHPTTGGTARILFAPAVSADPGYDGLLTADLDLSYPNGTANSTSPIGTPAALPLPATLTASPGNGLPAVAPTAAASVAPPLKVDPGEALDPRDVKLFLQQQNSALSPASSPTVAEAGLALPLEVTPSRPWGAGIALPDGSSLRRSAPVREETVLAPTPDANPFPSADQESPTSATARGASLVSDSADSGGAAHQITPSQRTAHSLPEPLWDADQVESEAAWSGQEDTLAVSSTRSPGGSNELEAGTLWQTLDRVEEQTGVSQPLEQAGRYSLGAFLAGSAYLLLNTRARDWLVSLLAARPLWRNLDPLEILFAWEKESAREEEDSLVDLVTET
jgi:hypothetical protein